MWADLWKPPGNEDSSVQDMKDPPACESDSVKCLYGKIDVLIIPSSKDCRIHNGKRDESQGMAYAFTD